MHHSNRLPEIYLLSPTEIVIIYQNKTSFFTLAVEAKGVGAPYLGFQYSPSDAFTYLCSCKDNRQGASLKISARMPSLCDAYFFKEPGSESRPAAATVSGVEEMPTPYSTKII
jgi:hypothetical protein